MHMSAVASMLEWAYDHGKQKYAVAKFELTQLEKNDNLWSWAEFHPDGRRQAEKFAEFLNANSYEAVVTRGSAYRRHFPAVRFRVVERRIQEG